MAKLNVERVLPYSAHDLSNMVGDIANYPQFIPWISFMHVSNRKNVSDKVIQCDAEAGVGFKFLNERFSTRVKQDLDDKSIEINLLKGPFNRLKCNWNFVDNNDFCNIKFNIDFEFKNPFLDAILRANFDKAVARLMACFEARALELYGHKSKP